MDLRPAWRISKLEMCAPFGWHLIDPSTLSFIRNKLSHFESMAWKEILINGKKNNHQVPISSLCKEAQKRIEDLQLEDLEQLLSLRLDGSGRVWGYIVTGIVTLLWWDPEHEVYPYHLKHT